MQNDKLLPCPFCGGEAIIHNVEPHTHILAKFMPDCKGESFIECTKCTCAMSGDTEKEVIEKWNTRKPMERILEQLEEVGTAEAKSYVSTGRCNGKSFTVGYIKGFEKAIEIVKGGVDNAE